MHFVHHHLWRGRDRWPGPQMRNDFLTWGVLGAPNEKRRLEEAPFHGESLTLGYQR